MPRKKSISPTRDFPRLAGTNDLIVGGMSRPLPRHQRSFPSVDDLAGPPLISLPAAGGNQWEQAEEDLVPADPKSASWDSEEYLKVVMDQEWAWLMRVADQGVWRPEVAWLDKIKVTVQTILAPALRDRFPTPEDLELFIANVTKLVWQYFWRQSLPTRVDRAFHAIWQLGLPWLRPDQVERLRAVQSGLREVIASKRRPGRVAASRLTAQQKGGRDHLLRQLLALFRRYTKLNKGEIEGYIARLLVKLKIEPGPIKNATARVHTALHRQRAKKSSPPSK